MAVFKIARDGHFYITTGEPTSTPGIVDETRSLTYSVLPRAKQIFIEAGFRHGQVIPKELFYALVVEGDITTGDLAPPSILSVPKAILSSAVSYENIDGLAGALSVPAQRAVRYVIDYFQVIHDRLHCSADRALREACMYSLAGRFRKYLDESGVLRAGVGRAPARTDAPEPEVLKNPVSQPASIEAVVEEKNLPEEKDYTSKLETRLALLKAENEALRQQLAEAEFAAAISVDPREQEAARAGCKAGFDSLAREVFQSLQIMAELMNLPAERAR